MSEFIAKKNKDITTLHETIKDQKVHIAKLESQLVENKEQSGARELKLL